MTHTSAKKRGFTLIELMVVVAIVGILLAIALPSYKDYLIRGNLVEGTNQLAAYRAQMEQYYQDARTYATSGAYTTPCPASVTSASGKWTYNCPAATLLSTGYSITATGVSGTVVAGFSYSVDQANNQISVTVPTGWGANGTTHWIMSRGG